MTDPSRLTITVGGGDLLNLADLQSPVKTGYLNKQTSGALFRSWKRRYFILRLDGCLYYYKNEQVRNLFWYKLSSKIQNYLIHVAKYVALRLRFRWSAVKFHWMGPAFRWLPLLFAQLFPQLTHMRLHSVFGSVVKHLTTDPGIVTLNPAHIN